MAPSATEAQHEVEVRLHPGKASTTSTIIKSAVKSTGVLDKFESFDVTPVIGREFVNANVVEWLQAPNADELIRELALTSTSSPLISKPMLKVPVSQRGVVFFRKQDNLTAELQKQLIQRIGLLSGKPSTSGLHIHPILNSEREDYRVTDPEISTIDSELNKKLYANNPKFNKKKQSSGVWHSDIAFEPKPADYSSLRLEVLPKTGGDTLVSQHFPLLCIHVL